MLKSVASVLTGLALVASPAIGQTSDEADVELGTLTCELQAVTNVLIYAEESFECTFVTEDGVTQTYDATIGKVGANLQLKTDQTLKWIVMSSVDPAKEQDLSGDYIGASAQASLGVGAGANLMVGGSGDNFTLQPLSLSGQEGIGASLTIDGLNLSRTS